MKPISKIALTAVILMASCMCVGASQKSKADKSALASTQVTMSETSNKIAANTHKQINKSRKRKATVTMQSIALPINKATAKQLIALNARFEQVLNFIEATDWTKVADGRIDIDSNRIYVNISHVKLKEQNKARLEVHDRYIDLQMPLEGSERFGVSNRANCLSPKGEISAKKDIMFYTDTPERYVDVKAGEFIVFMPSDAHAPLIGEGTIRKAVFKIKVD